MTNSIKAIWCGDVEVPNIEKSRYVQYTFISGGNSQDGWQWSMVSSFV